MCTFLEWFAVTSRNNVQKCNVWCELKVLWTYQRWNCLNFYLDIQYIYFSVQSVSHCPCLLLHLCIFIYFFFMTLNLFSFFIPDGGVWIFRITAYDKNTSVYSKIALADHIITSDCIRYSAFCSDMFSVLRNYCLTYDSMEDSDTSKMPTSALIPVAVSTHNRSSTWHCELHHNEVTYMLQFKCYAESER